MIMLVVFATLIGLIVAKPAPEAAAAPGPAAQVAVASADVISVEPSVGVVPVGTAGISKTVHYANHPIVTGYSSAIYKPDLRDIAAAIHNAAMPKFLTPMRQVHTIVPKITHVEPEITVHKVPLDVPVASPVVNEFEVRTPVHAVPAVPAAAIKSLSYPYPIYYSYRR